MNAREPREIARYRDCGWCARWAMECHREYGAPWDDCYKALLCLTGRRAASWNAVEAARDLAESPDIDWWLAHGMVAL